MAVFILKSLSLLSYNSVRCCVMLLLPMAQAQARNKGAFVGLAMRASRLLLRVPTYFYIIFYFDHFQAAHGYRQAIRLKPKSLKKAMLDADVNG